MAAYLLFFKAIHIIGFVAWFAGLFYLVRMFVYHRESFDEEETTQKILKAQFNLMEWRVYRIICNPAMVITWLFGVLIIFIYGMDWFLLNTWLQVKVILVIVLTGYHFYSRRVIVKMEKEERVMSSEQFRLFNEVPTILLFAIVLLAVYKSSMNYGLTALCLFLFAIVLAIFVRIYKYLRTRSN